VSQDGGFFSPISVFWLGTENRGFDGFKKFLHWNTPKNTLILFSEKNFGVGCTLKKYYDKNHIFPIAAIFKHKRVPVRKEMCCLLYSNTSFRSRDVQVLKINMQISPVMMSYTHQILIKYDGKRYLNQFVAEMFNSLQYNYT